MPRRKQPSPMIPKIPVGPSYRDISTPSRAANSGWAPVPLTAIGRVWGTSAIKEPSVIINSTSRSSARSSSSRVKLFHLIEGSVPLTIIKSRSKLGNTNPKISVVGHVTFLICDSSIKICGRFTWKS